MQLVSTNFPGNTHSASDQINRLGLAEFVLHMASTGHHTVVVFRVDDADAPQLRRDFGHTEEFCANPPPPKKSNRSAAEKHGVFAVPGGWAYRHFGLNAEPVGPFRDKAEAMKSLLGEVGFDVED